MAINIMQEGNPRGREEQHAVVPFWPRSSRRPLSGVMCALSTEAHSQPRGCLGEEGKASGRFGVWKGLGGSRKATVTGAAEDRERTEPMGSGTRGRQGQDEHNKDLE